MIDHIENFLNIKMKYIIGKMIIMNYTEAHINIIIIFNIKVIYNIIYFQYVLQFIANVIFKVNHCNYVIIKHLYLNLKDIFL